MTSHVTMATLQHEANKIAAKAGHAFRQYLSMQLDYASIAVGGLLLTDGKYEARGSVSVPIRGDCWYQGYEPFAAGAVARHPLVFHHCMEVLLVGNHSIRNEISKCHWRVEPDWEADVVYNAETERLALPVRLVGIRQ